MPLASRAVADLEQDKAQARDEERRRLRPFRVSVYAVYLAFTLTFVALVGRSIWLDLYGKGPVKGLRVEHPTPEACVEELERLFGKLASRSAFPTTANELRDWDEFSREFEDRLDEFESKCVDDPASKADVAVHDAIQETAAQLERWRQHLSRCGEEGEEERRELVRSIASLREAASR